MNKVTIDKNLCIACGTCVAISPENFDWDSDGKPKVIDETITDKTENAKDSCPMSAITIESEEKKD